LSHNVVRNVILVGILTLLVRSVSFVKEIIVADQIGLSELLDTFYIALLIPGLISTVFMGAFKSVFIPNYVAETKRGNNIGSFQSATFLITIGMSLFFMLIAVLLTDVYIENVFKGHTANYYGLIKVQFYYMLPCIIIWGISSIFNGLLTIDDEFKYSSVGMLFTPLTIILFLVFFRDELGEIVLALGTLIGSLLRLFMLFIVALNRKVIHLKKPDFYSSNIKEMFRQIPAKVSSGLLTGLNNIVDQYFAAQLVIGSIAALNYGIKIPMFIIGITTLALGKVLLPYFSKKAIEDKEKLFKELQKIIKILIFSSAIVAIILIVISTPIISIIFERNAFTSDDTVTVSKIQQMYLIQIPSYITGIIMVRFLTSINYNNFMVLAAIISLVLNIVLNYILISLMGVYGLALATSIVSIVNSLILYFYIIYLKNKLFLNSNNSQHSS
jgi:putative peptidoglycan lipid II flippase